MGWFKNIWNTNKGLKFLLRGFLLFVALSCFVTWIGKYNVGIWNGHVDRGFKELEMLVDEDDGPDVIFFSNSYLFTLLDPIYLESKTGLSGLHMGAPSLALPASLLHAEEALKMHKPKCVVFEICPRSSGYPNSESQWKYFSQALMTRGFSKDAVKVLWEGREHWPSQETFYEGVSLTTASYANLNHTTHYDNVTWLNEGYRGYKPLQGGDWTLHNVVTDEEFDGMYLSDNYPPAERQYFEWYKDDAFYEFLKRTSDNGIKVLLVETLKLDTWSKDGLDSLKEKYEAINPEMIQVVNWDTKEMKETMEFRQKDFYDLLHLRHEGALRFCEEISEDLKDFVDVKKGQSIGVLSLENGLQCQYSKFYGSEVNTQSMQFYFDSIPERFEDWNLCVRAYPKKAYLDKLGDVDLTKVDSSYARFIGLSTAIDIKDQKFIPASFYTSLRKSQIKKVEFYLIGSDEISDRITVYETEDDSLIFESDQARSSGGYIYSIFVILLLPIILLIYYLIAPRYRWVLLLSISATLVVYWSPLLSVFLLFSTVSSYFIARQLSSHLDVRSKRKKLLIIGVVLNLLPLFFFTQFPHLFSGTLSFIEWLDFSQKRNPVWTWVMPLGISFYTLQVIGYLMDVYRDKTNVETHFGFHALALCYFPKLVFGPIEDSKSLILKLKEPKTFNKDDAQKGVLLVLLGLVKVWVIAIPMQALIDTVFENPVMYGALELLVAIVFVAVQFYMLFSGFVQVGEGISLLFGIRLNKSFDSPLTSTSIESFWSRFNMSLTEWIAVYAKPVISKLLPEREKKVSVVLVSFLLMSLWYGAGMNFIIWGLVNGVLILFFRSPLMRGWAKRSSKSVMHVIITFLLFSLPLILLKTTSFKEAKKTFARLVEIDWLPVLNGSLYQLGMTQSRFIAVIVLSGVVIIGEKYLKDGRWVELWSKQPAVLRWFGYVSLILILAFFRSGEEYRDTLSFLF